MNNMPSKVKMKKSGTIKIVSNQVAESFIREGEADLINRTPDTTQGYAQRQFRPNKLKTK